VAEVVRFPAGDHMTSPARKIRGPTDNVHIVFVGIFPYAVRI